MVRKVIARAHRDEPLERIALRVRNRVAYLAQPAQLGAVMAGQRRAVAVPLEDVFVYDEAVYTALVAQWAGRGATDPETWRRLRPY